MNAQSKMNTISEWLGGLDHDELHGLILRAAEASPELLTWLDGERALNAEDPSELLGVVNATLTPRKRFYHYREAMDYGVRARSTVDLLSERAEEGSTELLKVIERAITLVTRAILRSDDSSGVQGDVVRDLLEIHARAACTANPPLPQGQQTRLVNWLVKYRYGGSQDFFDPDIVAYAPALSSKSIERYREAIEQIELGPYGTYPLTRLAVLDKDAEAILAARGGGLQNAMVAARVVADLEEAGLHQEAVEHALKALPDESHFSYDLVDFLVADALERGDAEAAVAFRKQRFEKEPTSTAFDRLLDTATEAGLWERERLAAEELLATRDVSGFIAYLLREQRVGEAWGLAVERIEPEDDVHTWISLCEHRAEDHPGETLPYYERIIRGVLVQTDKRHYRWAADLLKQMRTVATAAGAETEFAEFLAAVREENRRRPTCIRVFDRAGL